MNVLEPARTISTDVRACDSCGARDVEEIWSDDYTARTRTGAFRFINRNVVCRRCGFAFVAPVPRQSDLNAYYAASFAHYGGQTAASNIAQRADVVRSIVVPGLDGIEIGGNRLVHDDGLRRHFRSFASVEPNEEVGADYHTIDAVPDASADVLVHYYVLEHVSDPRAFLTHCRRILRASGSMICEVPDARLYVRGNVGDYLWWEHVSHFTTVSLARVAAASGFRLVDVGHRRCSFGYGVFAVFKREDAIADLPWSVPDPAEVTDAIATMREAARLVVEFRAHLAAVRAEIDAVAARGGAVVLWGANEVMRQLLATPYVLPEESLVVDDDERKAYFIDGVTVRRPGEVREHLAASRLLVIASSRLADLLEKRARSIAGPAFAPDVRIVDYEMSRVQ